MASVNNEMKFEQFYESIQNRIEDAILSLWANGNKSFQDELRQLFKKEPLLGEPVFQSAFPWESIDSTFEKTGLFNSDFVERLNKADGSFRFDKNIIPYKHQLKSWETLLDNKIGKSIAVTTGTGSGKTECFMIPILHDLYTNNKHSNGVNALFLYPLNALIGSQKKRMSAWCDQLDGLRYAVYNGQTPESVNQSEQKKYPKSEAPTRRDIRERAPQILFTNPVMLEYILIRKQDKSILEQSQGKLKWIIIDEAHTYTGSNAAELALLIRRIKEAFNVNDNLRFAITSATVGDKDKEEMLINFMSDLCGIEKSKVAVISGERTIGIKKDPTMAQSIPKDFFKNNKDNYFDFKEFRNLRQRLLKNNFITIDDVIKDLKLNSISITDVLRIIDNISEITENKINLFPVRGHFFVRSLFGLYKCINKECTEFYGQPNLTTYKSPICKCGSPMVEINECGTCGNILYKTKKSIDRRGNELIELDADAEISGLFGSNDTEEETNQSENGFYFSKIKSNNSKDDHFELFNVDKNGLIKRNGDTFDFEFYLNSNSNVCCPHCKEPIFGSNGERSKGFTISGLFINRIIADIILDSTPAIKDISINTSYKGKKYLSFTDNRQGTARLSGLINQEKEKLIFSSKLYYAFKNQVNESLQINKNEIEEYIAYLENELKKPIPPAVKKDFEKKIEEYRNKLNNKIISISFLKILEYFQNNHYEIKEVLNNISNYTNNKGHLSVNKYCTISILDYFRKPLKNSRTLESLGILSVDFPKLYNYTKLPEVVQLVGINKNEWDSLLKIATHIIIRQNNHVHLLEDDNEYYKFKHYFQQISFNSEEKDSTKLWPKFNKSYLSRLPLLILAGLGHDTEDIDEKIETNINEILEQLWIGVRRILKPNSINGTKYDLNLIEEASFSIGTKFWRCPATGRLIDAHFRGYSPWIKGKLSPENIEYFKIKDLEGITFPYLFQDEMNAEQAEFSTTEKEAHLSRNKNKLNEIKKSLQEKAVWSDFYEQIFWAKPVYWGVEHTAQQRSESLRKYEEDFEAGIINILNCSTTMEMGVDIGGVSAVLMNNVPPHPANYLQRVGRAGRRNESKSLALTICPPNPIGLNLFKQTSWPFISIIPVPSISLDSKTIVQRHINAYFLGLFIQEIIEGINIRDSIEFFFIENPNENIPLADKFIEWISFLEEEKYSIALNRIKKQTVLNKLENISLANRTKIAFEDVKNRVLDTNNELTQVLSEKRNQFGEASNEYKAVNYKLNNFNKKNAISFLVEKGFLPNSGMPVGVLEFDITNIEDIKNEHKVESPSHSLQSALAEYAPGNQVVINNSAYESRGILLNTKFDVKSTINVVQKCTNCGHSRLLPNSKNIKSDCPICEGQMRGVFGDDKPYTTIIEPAGFAVDLISQPKQYIKTFSTAKFLSPTLLETEAWLGSENSIIDIRVGGKDSELLFYNDGIGFGFTVCLQCGWSKLSNHKHNEMDESEYFHYPLRGGKEKRNRNGRCNASQNLIKKNVLLAGRFKTDFVELRVLDNNKYSDDKVLLYTLGTIFTQTLVLLLGIEEKEIDFGIKTYGDYDTIFIYDTSRGGAGYSPLIIGLLDDVIKESLKKLEICDCGKACPKCLINRTSQWNINKLNRIRAIEWLKNANINIVESEYMDAYGKISKPLGGSFADISHYRYQNKLEAVKFFITPDAILNEAWFGYKVIQSLIDTEIVFTFPEDPNNLNTIDKLIIFRLQARYNAKIVYEKNADSSPLAIKLAIKTTNGNFAYHSKHNSEVYEQPIYKTSDYVWDNLKDVRIIFKENNIKDFKLHPIKSIDSNKLLSQLIPNIGFDIFKPFKNENITITYNDRYITKPIDVIILVQFIDEFRKATGSTIDSITLIIDELKPTSKPTRLFDKYETHEEGIQSIITLFEQVLMAPKIEKPAGHNRKLEIKSKKNTLEIYPDAGLAHGLYLDKTKCREQKISYYYDKANAKTVYPLSLNESEKYFIKLN